MANGGWGYCGLNVLKEKFDVIVTLPSFLLRYVFLFQSGLDLITIIILLLFLFGFATAFFSVLSPKWRPFFLLSATLIFMFLGYNSIRGIHVTLAPPEHPGFEQEP